MRDEERLEGASRRTAHRGVVDGAGVHLVEVAGRPAPRQNLGGLAVDDDDRRVVRPFGFPGADGIVHLALDERLQIEVERRLHEFCRFLGDSEKPSSGPFLLPLLPAGPLRSADT